MRARVILRLGLGLLLAGLGATACGGGKGTPSNQPEAVADRFVDLYLVEVDQARARDLATGDARQRLEDELASVKGVRDTGYGPAQAKPRVYYERRSFVRDPAGHRVRAIYDVTIKQGEVTDHRHALVALHDQEGGAWRVSFFTVQEGPAPAAPTP